MSTNLHVERIGEGPTVVVLHGLFGAGRNWLSVARHLSRRYEFHLLDLRNHGRSPHRESMSYLDMASDVRSYLDRTGLDAISLVGHSMGGKVAMTLALTEPQGIARLLNIDIAPVSYPDRFAEMIEAMLALELSSIRRRGEADELLQAAIPEKTVRQFVLQNLVFSDGEASWRANLTALKAQMPEILGPLPVAPNAQFGGPTWFIRGELSDRVQQRHFELMRNWFPNYQLETVSGGGHWPHAEAPAAFMLLFERALGN